MSKKQPLISKITIRMGDKDVEMTTEQAKELQGALNELFGKPAEHHTHIHNDYPWVYRPFRWHFDTVPYGTYSSSGSRTYTNWAAGHTLEFTASAPEVSVFTNQPINATYTLSAGHTD